MRASSFLRLFRFAGLLVILVGNVVLAQNLTANGPALKGSPQNRSQPSSYVADGSEHVRFAEPEVTRRAGSKNPILH